MAELEVAHIDGIPTNASDLRSAYNALRPGVYGDSDLKVTTGAGLSVDVAAGVAFMPAPSALSDLGLYRGRNDAAMNSSAFALGGIAANPSASPRLDQVIARAYDANYDGSGLKRWRLEILTGVPTAGATLDNRNGALALPQGAARLADLLVPAANPLTIPSGNIRDRRARARGAYVRSLRNVGASVSVGTSPGLIDATNLAPRIECSGIPIRMTFTALWTHSDALGAMWIYPRVDGADVDGFSNGFRQSIVLAGAGQVHSFTWETVPAAGSHIIAPYAATNLATCSIYDDATTSVLWSVEEIAKPNASNS